MVGPCRGAHSAAPCTNWRGISTLWPYRLKVSTSRNPPAHKTARRTENPESPVSYDAMTRSTLEKGSWRSSHYHRIGLATADEAAKPRPSDSPGRTGGQGPDGTLERTPRLTGADRRARRAGEHERFWIRASPSPVQMAARSSTPTLRDPPLLTDAQQLTKHRSSAQCRPNAGRPA